MLDKHDSFNGSLLSYQSDSQNIVKILFEKIPDVEEILTNSIKILEDENYERSDSKQDLISAFIEILEIYELTSKYTLLKKYLSVLIIGKMTD